MGWNPFKSAKKLVKKVDKPFRKISQKFIPRELRWAAPYLAAATPFMLPAGGFGASGLFSSAAGRAALSSLANVAGQAVADPEGDDINLLSTLMAGGTGYLSGPDVASNLRSGIETGGAGTSAREAAIMKASGVTPLSIPLLNLVPIPSAPNAPVPPAIKVDSKLISSPSGSAIA